jgi:hypothetical protein
MAGQCIVDVLVHASGTQGILETVPKRMEDATGVRDA